jgi:AcrR family transcriptional regulator
VSLTKPQQDRHERMLNVTSRLAAEGGYDAVQMRAVAVEADVALGTLYRYFPSKEHLLVSAMLRQIESLHDRLVVRPPEGTHAVDRVVDVLRRANSSLQRQQLFTIAVVRALASGDETVAPVVREVRDLMAGIILSAIQTTEPTERERLVTEILQEVWLSSLVAWISGVEPTATVNRKLEDAARVLLNGHE